MILTIAILSLVALVSGIYWDLFESHPQNPRPIIFTIAILTWWNISLTVSIIIMVVAVYWIYTAIGGYTNNDDTH